MAFDKSKEYKPGEKCEASGIYRVTHDEHHPEHEVTVVLGEPFPPCKGCGHNARFVVKDMAHHLATHELFKK